LTPLPTPTYVEVGKFSPTPVSAVNHKPTRTPSTFIFGAPPAAPPEELPDGGFTGSESPIEENLIGPESAPETKAGGPSSKVLWGTGAVGLIAAATGIAMEVTRRRKEAEARMREEMARRNALAEAREAAEQQRLAELMAIRQEAALRLDEFLKNRDHLMQQRMQSLEATQEADRQQQVAKAAQQEVKQQINIAFGTLAAASTAIAAASRRREARKQYLERNLGLYEPASYEVPSPAESKDIAETSEVVAEPAKKPIWAPVVMAAADAWFWYDSKVNPIARTIVAETLISAHEEVEEFNYAMDVLRDRNTSIEERWDAIGEIADTGVNVATLGAWGDVRIGAQEGDWLRVATGAFGIIPVGRLARPGANLAARYAPRFLGNADDAARLTRTVSFAIGHADDAADLTYAGREIVLGIKNDNLGQVAGGVLYGLRPGVRLTRDTLMFRASMARISNLGRVELVGLGGQSYNLNNVPLDSLSVRTTDGIIVIPPDQWAVQGAGILPDDIPVIPRGSTPDGIMYQIPADWKIGAQDSGLGLKIESPDGKLHVRIHGPTTNAKLPVTAPGRHGWVARAQHYDPNNPLAPDFGPNKGWVSHNDLGQEVPTSTDAAHIPVLDNLAVKWYDPSPSMGRPSMREVLEYFDILKESLRGTP
jgi:hypothetical protein